MMLKILIVALICFSFDLQAVSIFESDNEDNNFYLQNYQCKDGHQIRCGFFFSESENKPKKTLIIFLQGMGSFIEKDCETIYDFNVKGYDVFSFDWRSQGGSSRFLEDDSQKIHVPSFDLWLDDLDNLWELKEIRAYENIVFVGASMGGHLLLRNLLERDIWSNLNVRGVIFLTPMIDIYTFKLPYFLSHLYVKYKALKTPLEFVTGFKFYDFDDGYKEHVLSANDINRALIAFNISRAYPDYVTSGPTWYFLHKMLDSLETLHAQSKQFNDIPSLWITAKDDSILDNSRILDFIGNQSELKIYDCVTHNLFDEKNEIRERLFHDMNRFIRNVTP